MTCPPLSPLASPQLQQQDVSQPPVTTKMVRSLLKINTQAITWLWEGREEQALGFLCAVLKKAQPRLTAAAARLELPHDASAETASYHASHQKGNLISDLSFEDVADAPPHGFHHHHHGAFDYTEDHFFCHVLLVEEPDMHVACQELDLGAACALLAYNAALVHHKRAIQQGCLASWGQARSLYLWSLSTLASSCNDASTTTTSAADKFYTTTRNRGNHVCWMLRAALLDNLGHVACFFQDAHLAVQCHDGLQACLTSSTSSSAASRHHHPRHEVFRQHLANRPAEMTTPTCAGAA